MQIGVKLRALKQEIKHKVAIRPLYALWHRNTLDDIMMVFRKLDIRNNGLFITEAAIVGGTLRFRWQVNGKLGVVVGDICLRPATEAEYDELEDAVELGQVQIYGKPRYVSGQVATQTVYHQATGNPLDQNSEAARRQRERWARADALRAQRVEGTDQV